MTHINNLRYNANIIPDILRLLDLSNRARVSGDFLLICELWKKRFIPHWLQSAKEHDLIVDAPSTGNFIALLEAVSTAQKLFDGGSLRRMADEIQAFLQEGTNTKVICVSLPENSSLEESQTVLRYVAEHFPNIQCEHWLNRKHEVFSSSTVLPPMLQALAKERPLREALCTD